jgi:hypothetical protein
MGPHARLALDFSRPGKPTGNAFVKSFNGKFRSECLKRQLVPESRRGSAKMRGLA